MKMRSASILRRMVVSLKRSSPVKDCTGGKASELVGRPSLMVPPHFAKKKVEYKFYSPLKKEIVGWENRGGEEEVDLIKNKRNYWVGSSHGWLVLYNNGPTYDMCLLNPLSGRRIQLPPFRGEPFSDGEFPFKVILSHSPVEEECRAVMILGARRDRAAFCSPGRSEKWSPWNDPVPLEKRKRKSACNDIVYSASRKSFVSAVQVISGSWISGSLVSDDLEFWDATMVKTTTVRAPSYTMSDPGYIWLTYVVSEEESGRLFMVRRYLIDDKRVAYNVYSIITDDDGQDVVQLCESLNGVVMFIGINHCFAVKASKYPEYVPNAIYFSGIWFRTNQFADIYNYNTKAYVQLFDLTPNQKYPFDNLLHWFTLTQDKKREDEKDEDEEE